MRHRRPGNPLWTLLLLAAIAAAIMWCALALPDLRDAISSTMEGGI